MVALASVTDLANWLGETIPAGDPRATRLIELASAAVQNHTGQTIVAVAGDAVDLPGGDTLLLPQRPVTAVTQVSVDGGVVTGFTFTTSGVVRRDGGFGTSSSTVRVTYDHGYTVIPDDLVAVTVQVAARAWSNPTDLRREDVGGYSATYNDTGIALTDAERATLDRHFPRRRVVSVPIVT